MIKEFITNYFNDCNPKAITNIRYVLVKEFPNDLQTIQNFPGETLIEKIYCFLNDRREIDMCEQCHIALKRFNGFKNGYDRFCSKKCHNLATYGYENPMKNKSVSTKCAKTYETKTGYKHQSQNPIVQNKMWSTYKQKTGYEHPSKNPNFMSTYMQETGFNSPLENPAVRDLCKKSNLKNHGGQLYNQTEEFKIKLKKSRIENKEKISNAISKARRKNEYHKLHNLLNDCSPCFDERDYVGQQVLVGVSSRGTTYNRYLFKCKLCGYDFEDLINGRNIECPKCYPKIQSAPEEELKAFVVSLGFRPKFNDRVIIAPLELDIFIPEKNIAIEFNGLFWHSEINGTPKKYHLIKTQACEKIGIRLIQIFEDEWRQNRKLVQARIKHILGMQTFSIGARKTSIVELSTNEKYRFLELNHLQGDCKSKFNYGLMYKNRLCAIMTFSKPRMTLGKTCADFELVRFCQLRDISIVGAASKLLQYFKKVNPGKSIVSYADRRWSDGKLYEKLGFKLERVSPPNYWYFKNGTIYHRAAFMKHTLKEKLENFDESLSEWENMKNNGWNRIFDCGNLVYIMNNL